MPVHSQPALLPDLRKPEAAVNLDAIVLAPLERGYRLFTKAQEELEHLPRMTGPKAVELMHKTFNWLVKVDYAELLALFIPPIVDPTKEWDIPPKVKWEPRDQDRGFYKLEVTREDRDINDNACRITARWHTSPQPAMGHLPSWVVERTIGKKTHVLIDTQRARKELGLSLEDRLKLLERPALEGCSDKVRRLFENASPLIERNERWHDLCEIRREGSETANKTVKAFWIDTELKELLQSGSYLQDTTVSNRWRVYLSNLWDLTRPYCHFPFVPDRKIFEAAHNIHKLRKDKTPYGITVTARTVLFQPTSRALAAIAHEVFSGRGANRVLFPTFSLGSPLIGINMDLLKSCILGLRVANDKPSLAIAIKLEQTFSSKLYPGMKPEKPPRWFWAASSLAVLGSLFYFRDEIIPDHFLPLSPTKFPQLPQFDSSYLDATVRYDMHLRGVSFPNSSFQNPIDREFFEEILALESSLNREKKFLDITLKPRTTLEVRNSSKLNDRVSAVTRDAQHSIVDGFPLTKRILSASGLLGQVLSGNPDLAGEQLEFNLEFPSAREIRYEIAIKPSEGRAAKSKESITSLTVEFSQDISLNDGKWQGEQLVRISDLMVTLSAYIEQVHQGELVAFEAEFKRVGGLVKLDYSFLKDGKRVSRSVEERPKDWLTNENSANDIWAGSFAGLASASFSSSAAETLKQAVLDELRRQIKMKSSKLIEMMRALEREHKARPKEFWSVLGFLEDQVQSDGDYAEALKKLQRLAGIMYGQD